MSPSEALLVLLSLLPHVHWPPHIAWLGGLSRAAGLIERVNGSVRALYRGI